MGKQNNALLWVIVAILVVLGVVYFNQQANGPAEPAEETGPIVIGAIAPLTGDAAAYGTPDQNAKVLAVSEINAAGGVNGRELQVIWEDGKCNGTDATTAAQKLLNVDGVDIILGGSCSGETLAAAALTQPARALLLSAMSTSPDITTAGDLVFRTYPSDAFAGRLMAAYAAKELGFERAAIISENTDFAQGLRKVFSAEFIAQGKNIVFDEAFNTGDTDFRTLITKMKAGNPQVVYVITQTFTPSELILKQMKEANIRATVMGSDPLLDREALAANPALFEGVILPQVALDETNPKTKAFLDAYVAKYATEPEFPGYLAAGYDSVYLLVEAMEAVGEDPEAIAQYFNESVNDWPGAIGTFNFDDNGDAVISLNIGKIAGGEVVDLGPYPLE
jgi:branched-chain amino acid transport system substrate-binding protein